MAIWQFVTKDWIFIFKEGKEVYEDPVNGFHMFTILSHLQRGDCCGNACRHVNMFLRSMVKYSCLSKE